MIESIWAELDGYIGKDGDLLVKCRKDMEFFKNFTMGRVLIMGRKTVDSLPFKLPGREVICLTRDTSYTSGKADHIVHSKEEALALANDNAVVCGGGEIYDLFMDECERLVVVEFFPECFHIQNFFNCTKAPMPSKKFSLSGKETLTNRTIWYYRVNKE